MRTSILKDLSYLLFAVARSFSFPTDSNPLAGCGSKEVGRGPFSKNEVLYIYHPCSISALNIRSIVPSPLSFCSNLQLAGVCAKANDNEKTEIIIKRNLRI